MRQRISTGASIEARPSLAKTRHKPARLQLLAEPEIVIVEMAFQEFWETKTPQLSNGKHIAQWEGTLATYAFRQWHTGPSDRGQSKALMGACFGWPTSAVCHQGWAQLRQRRPAGSAPAAWCARRMTRDLPTNCAPARSLVGARLSCCYWGASFLPRWCQFRPLQ